VTGQLQWPLEWSALSSRGGSVDLGSRLKRLRTTKGLTQKQLAEPQYTHAFISSIEAGRRRPSDEAVRYFAARLGVSSEELLTGRSPDVAEKLELDLLAARKSVSAGALPEAEQTFNRVATLAARNELPRLRSKAVEGLALCALHAGAVEVALERYERAESILASEPVTARVDAVSGQAKCLRMLGDLSYAIYLLERALEIINREGLSDPSALLRIHASLVPPYFESGAYAKASQAASEALKLASHAPNHELIGDMHMNVARVFLSQGNVEEAKSSLRRAEEIFTEGELQTETAHCHLALGFVLSREAEYEGAREEFERAIDAFKSARSVIDEANASIELARVERLAGDDYRALHLLESSIALLAGGADVPMLAAAHRELGLCRIDEDPTAAEKEIRTAIELYERAGEQMDLAATYRILGDLLHRQGDARGGCEAFRAGILAIESTL
jgi:tetratricopeptide (TPR) repeat protein